MPDTHCVAEPLADFDREVLRAYVERDVGQLQAIVGFNADVWAEAIERLKGRGLLQPHKRGTLVTPEGLAASLGS